MHAHMWMHTHYSELRTLIFDAGCYPRYSYESYWHAVRVRIVNSPNELSKIGVTPTILCVSGMYHMKAAFVQGSTSYKAALVQVVLHPCHTCLLSLGLVLHSDSMRLYMHCIPRAGLLGSPGWPNGPELEGGRVPRAS